MKRVMFILIAVSALLACSNSPCKVQEHQTPAVKGDELVSSSAKDLTTRVFIYKPDGSLQCGMGSKVDVNEMKKELGAIQVFSAVNKHDGMMRTQVCGAATGYSNVYEINKKDFDEAVKLGFKKWTHD